MRILTTIGLVALLSAGCGHEAGPTNNIPLNGATNAKSSTNGQSEASNASTNGGNATSNGQTSGTNAEPSTDGDTNNLPDGQTNSRTKGDCELGLDPCEPICQTGCDDGMQCDWNYSARTSGCVPVGDLQEGESCGPDDQDDQCAAGLDCVDTDNGRRCMRMCKVGAGDRCPATLECVPYPATGGTMGVCDEPPEMEILLIQDMSPNTGCESETPGTDLFEVSLETPGGSVFGSALFWGPAGMNNQYVDFVSVLDGQAPTWSGDCPSALSPHTVVSLGCGGWVTVQFVSAMGPIVLDEDSNATVDIQLREGACAPSEPQSTYQVSICPAGTRGDFARCVPIGEPRTSSASVSL